MEAISHSTAKKPDRTPRLPSDSQRLLTGTQVEKIYGLPYRSLIDLVARGTLPVVKFPESRRLWFDRADIEALIVRSRERRA